MSNALVQKQYNDWAFPTPIEDLENWAKDHCQICDPQYHAAIIWPDQPPKNNLSILVAGCGTSQAAILAYTNPQAKIIGIDFSAASLAHTEKLKAKHNLSNLTLREMDLHDVASLGQKFNLIYATGVLHHLSDPLKGLKALAGVAADDGVLCLMLYAKYGRAGVTRVQEALRIMDVAQTQHGILTARNVLASLPANHPAQDYIRGAGASLDFNSCFVDTFLHKQECVYTVPEVLQLARDAGLDFQSWVDNFGYYPDCVLDTDHPAYQTIALLPQAQQWAVSELLYQNSGIHSFLLRKPSNAILPINFESEEYLNWYPARRYLLEVIEGKDSIRLRRHEHVLRLSGFEKDIFQAINGQKTCGDVTTSLAQNSQQRLAAKELFSRLERVGHLVYRHYKF